LEYIGLNVKKPPFDDPKVREAFALALDVNKLISVTLKGRTERAAGYLPKGVPGYNSSLLPIPYDAAKAKQLITESKYGSISNLPSVTMDVLYGVTPLQQAIIGMWQQNLGVQIRVETISELETYFTRMRNDEFQLFVSGWVADYIDPQNFLDVLFQSESSENDFAYSNTEVDTALILAAAESDNTARIKMYQDIETLVLADLPLIPLTQNDKDYVLLKPYVKGYKPLPISTTTIWRDIYVEAH
jgi:ABC-type transport system substrate-binding protein